jgi:CheY-like chemotaxis protein
VLVVDDNEVNQIVAVELLESMGLRVDVASSGEDAIEAIETIDYALVLMDCQMPGMDGYETARELRRRGQRLPIVAFTAHVLVEEREKVLRAGMDDYLTKPIDPEELSAVLSRQLGTAARAAMISPTPTQPQVRSQAGAEDLTRLELLQPGLRRSPQAVETFFRKAPEDLTQLHEAVRAMRHDEVRRIAHKLKGSAGSLGALQLARLCERLEHAAANASGEASAVLVVALDQAYQRTSAELKQQREHAAAKELTP